MTLVAVNRGRREASRKEKFREEEEKKKSLSLFPAGKSVTSRQRWEQGEGCGQVPGDAVIPVIPDASNKRPLWGLIAAGHPCFVFGGFRVIFWPLGCCWKRQTGP